MEHNKAKWGFIFVLPSLVFFAIFSFYPIFNAFYLSLHKKNLLSLRPPQFIGFDNYEYLFHSSDFWNSVLATTIFALGTFIPLLVISLLLAALIMTRRRFQKFFQMAFYSPAVLSSVVAAVIWLLVFDPRGLGNQFLNTLFNSPGVDHKWLATDSMLRFSTMLVYFWKYIGYFTIIFIAGMSSIPSQLHEAAYIDGANRWQGFWRVTFPLLKPTVLLVSVMSMIQCLKTFSTQYLFTQAGTPSKPINVITMNIYNTAIRDHRIGRASAMSVLLFVVMLFFTALQIKSSKSDDVSFM